MSPRIFLAALICAAALSACTAIDSGVRPEIAQPLSRAEALFQRGDRADAMKNIMVAEDVPDLTAGEKRKVALVKNFITPYGSGRQSGFGNNFSSAPYIGDNRPSLGVDSYLPPGDVGPNDPNR